jgi:hypothetical protein
MRVILPALFLVLIGPAMAADMSRPQAVRQVTAPVAAPHAGWRLVNAPAARRWETQVAQVRGAGGGLARIKSQPPELTGGFVSTVTPAACTPQTASSEACYIASQQGRAANTFGGVSGAAPLVSVLRR